MNGPEHYRAGEKLLAEVNELPSEAGMFTAGLMINLAQAHFMAAQVDMMMDVATSTGNVHIEHFQQWLEVM